MTTVAARGRPLRWGLLSTAAINAKLLAAAQDSAAAEVVAVASRSSTRARAYAAAHAIPRAHGSYDELLGDPEIDAVYVSLPNALHHEWSMRALRAGKHVLCEKPYSRHPEEVIEAFDLAEQEGLVLAEGYMFRHHPQIRRLAELAGTGAIGDVRLIAAAFSWPCADADSICLDASLDGGGLLDVGCYCVSAARMLAGEPLEATARARFGPTGVDVAMAATLTFADGVLAQVGCGLDGPERSVLEVIGTRGTITVSDPWHGARPGLALTRLDGRTEAIMVPAANAYQLELEAVAAAVRGAPSTLPGRADALGQAAVLGALLASAAGARASS